MTHGTRKNRNRAPDRSRRTRKVQRGGGEINSIASWIAAVKKTPAFRAEEDKYIKQPEAENDALWLGSYTIGDLIDDSLKLPEKERDANQLFVRDEEFLFDRVNDVSDFRDIAVALRLYFANIVNSNPTPNEFLRDIKEMKEDPSTDSTILQTIQFAETIEVKLKLLDNPNADILPYDVLVNEQNYPLFILTLVANTDMEQEIPILLSEAELVNQLSDKN